MNMKRLVFFMTVLALVATGCNQGKKFTVSGDLKSSGMAPYADTLVLTSEAFEAPVKLAVQNKRFQFNDRVKKPAYANLTVLGHENRYNTSLILEKGTVTFQDGQACGTPLNDAAVQFLAEIKEIVQVNKEDKEVCRNLLKEAFFAFVAQHKDDPCAIFAILRSYTALYPADVIALIESASPEVQNNGAVRSLKTKMKQQL